MSCLLCLKKESKQIKICSNEGKQLNCSFIIAKHFWFQQSTLEDSDNSICFICWNVVHDFHQFYRSVGEAHNFLLSTDAKLNTLDQETLDNPTKLLKLEESNIQTTSIGDLNDPEVDAISLNLLPQIEVIESNENEKGKDSLETIEDSCINQPLKRCIKRESSSSFNDDSDIEPLSTLLPFKSKLTLEANSLDEKEDTESNANEVEDSPPQLYNAYNENSSDIDECHNNRNIKQTHNETKKSFANLKPNLTMGHKQHCKERSETLPLKTQKYDKTIAKFFEKLKCTRCELSCVDFGELKQHFKTLHKRNVAAFECCGRKFYSRKSLSDHALFHLHPEYLKCSQPKCDKVFKDSFELNEHKKVCETKVFHCPKCVKTFSDKRSVKEHQAVHIAKSDYNFSCSECSLQFATKRRVQHHMRYIHQGATSCEKCGKQLKNLKALKIHILDHKEETQHMSVPIQCDICGEWLKQAKSLQKHKVLVHEQHTEEHYPNIAKFFKNFKCTKCESAYESFSDLKQHFKALHKGNVPNVVCCGRKFYTLKTLSDHSIFHLHPAHLSCSYLKCDKIFKDTCELQAHEETHKAFSNEVVEVFQCTKCSKTFSSKNNLREHQAVHIPKSDYIFSCTECGLKFATKKRVQHHMRDIHHVGSIICEICGKQARNPKALRMHMLNHTEKPKQTSAPVQCDICGKWLKQAKSLSQHKTWVHKQRTEQQCPICNVVSSNLRALERHIFRTHKTESKFKCTMCEKAYKTIRELLEHKNIHTREVIYTCEICLKTFIRKASMVRHKKNFHSENSSKPL